MPSRKKGQNAISRLNAEWSHLATDWSKGNPEIAGITGESIFQIRSWRRPHVEAYYAEKGVLPPLSHVRVPSSIRSRRPNRELVPLDVSHGHLIHDWNASVSRIARESGHHRASVNWWRRRHLKAWIAQGNEPPICTCGKELLHKGGCTQTPLHLRREAATKIIAGSDPDAVARTYRTDRASVVSWALTTLPRHERAAFRQEVSRRRAERTQRMRELAGRRKAGDERHRRILSLVREGNPEGDDAVQEAYLAMLEEDLTPEEAARIGSKRAWRMSEIGWKPTSLDAPLREDGDTTRGDLLPDARPDQSSSLHRIDADRMEGAVLHRPPTPARAPPSGSDTRTPTTHPDTPEPRNEDMHTPNHDDILTAVLAAHKATGRNMTKIAAESRIRNVDVCSILGGRKQPNEGQLARLADHFGIPHSITWQDRRPAAFQKGGGKRKATTGAGKGQRKPKSAEGRTKPVDTARADQAPVTPVVTAAPAPISSDDGSLIDSVVAALLSAKNADSRLAEARANLAAAELEREEQRLRADAAEAKLAELEGQLEQVRSIVAGAAATTVGRKIAA